ncbi:sulfite exporter TauE/SafE family protein [bacterium]|nr:sulfite exporter TauE/SafE family protein [bacterium]
MIWTGFIMGLLGSVHCAAMCGPLMLGLSMKGYNWVSLIQHHLGRWIGYIILAFILKLLITPLQMMEWQQTIGIISGVLILLYGLKSYIKPINTVFEKTVQLLSSRMLKQSGSAASLSLGVLNGLLPCGLSFAAASLSINFTMWSETMFFMVLFGLGTLPVLFVMAMLPQWGKLNLVQKMNKILPKALILIGFLIVFRSAGLGIPYVSPAFETKTESVNCCAPK